MIQANELRIGNWVEKFTDWEDSLGYSPILPEEFLAIHTKPERVNPIPLTEEILLKCGFEKYGDFWYVLGNIKIEVTTRGYFRFSGYVRIYHLHQLQNLIFALTGEELEVEL